MKFYIGTNNPQKVEATSQALLSILGERKFGLEGKDVPSGFGETPHDEETMRGAENRASELMKLKDCDYAIGLESGLVERYGHIFEEAWCCIISKEKTAYGYSSGLKVPDIITDKMASDQLEHYQVLRLEEIKALLPVKTRKDTWGNYSDLLLTRQISFEEALRNALVQIFSSDNSLYSK